MSHEALVVRQVTQSLVALSRSDHSSKAAPLVGARRARLIRSRQGVPSQGSAASVPSKRAGPSEWIGRTESALENIDHLAAEGGGAVPLPSRPRRSGHEARTWPRPWTEVVGLTIGQSAHAPFGLAVPRGRVPSVRAVSQPRGASPTEIARQRAPASPRLRLGGTRETHRGGVERRRRGWDCRELIGESLSGSSRVGETLSIANLRAARPVFGLVFHGAHAPLSRSCCASQSPTGAGVRDLL